MGQWTTVGTGLYILWPLVDSARDGGLASLPASVTTDSNFDMVCACVENVAQGEGGKGGRELKGGRERAMEGERERESVRESERTMERERERRRTLCLQKLDTFSLIS